MPKITDLVAHPLNDNFGYSAVKLDKLGSPEYTLVQIICDKSGSVAGFQTELEKCIKEVVESCKFSKRADNLMIRLTTFSSSMNEVHGFQLLTNINTNDYDNTIVPSGQTALYDAVHNGVQATSAYGKQLTDQGYDANAIVVVITDGEENCSTAGINMVKKAFEDASHGEMLESLVSILVAVNMNNAGTKNILDQFHKDVGFTQFVAIDDANKKNLAKLAQFVSKSISAQSQALNSGGPSKALTF